MKSQLVGNTILLKVKTCENEVVPTLFCFSNTIEPKTNIIFDKFVKNIQIIKGRWKDVRGNKYTMTESVWATLATLTGPVVPDLDLVCVLLLSPSIFPCSPSTPSFNVPESVSVIPIVCCEGRDPETKTCSVPLWDQDIFDLQFVFKHVFSFL